MRRLSSRVLLAFWNEDEGRLRALWRIVLSLVLLGATSMGAAWAFSRAREAQEQNIEAAFSDASLFMVWTLVVLFAVLLACRWLDRRTLDDLGIRVDAAFWMDAGFGLALGGVLMGGILGAEVALDWAVYARAPEIGGDVPRLAYVPIAGFAFLSVAITEEVLFRGYQLTNLAEGLESRWLPGASAVLGATLISSALFGFAHGNNPEATMVSTGNIVLAGLMLAAGYVTTGRLAIPIGLHMSWNFFQNLFGMPVSGQTTFFHGAVLARDPLAPEWITGGAFGPEAGVTGLVAILLGTLLTLVYVRLRYGALGVCASIASPPSRVRAALPKRWLPARS